MDRRPCGTTQRARVGRQRFNLCRDLPGLGLSDDHAGHDDVRPPPPATPARCNRLRRHADPGGHTLVATSLVTDPDFGPVRLRIGTTAQPAPPFIALSSVLAPAGRTVLAMKTPDGSETLAAGEVDLRPGTSYTVLCLGGARRRRGWSRWSMPPRRPIPAPDDPHPHRNRRRPGRPPPGREEPGPPDGDLPYRIRIPSLALDAPVGTLPRDALGTLPAGLPLDRIAWLTGSSPLGAPGTTMLLGHTTRSGHGGFAQLESVEPGAQIELVGPSGSWLYTVKSSGTFPSGALPPAIWAPRPVPTLALVTRTRYRNPDTGSADNRVVWATAD